MQTKIPIASFQDKDVQYATPVTKRDHLNTSILRQEAYSLLRVSYMNLNWAQLQFFMKGEKKNLDEPYFKASKAADYKQHATTAQCFVYLWRVTMKLLWTENKPDVKK